MSCEWLRAQRAGHVSGDWLRTVAARRRGCPTRAGGAEPTWRTSGAARAQQPVSSPRIASRSAAGNSCGERSVPDVVEPFSDAVISAESASVWLVRITTTTLSRPNSGRTSAKYAGLFARACWAIHDAAAAGGLDSSTFLTSYGVCADGGARLAQPPKAAPRHSTIRARVLIVMLPCVEHLM